MRKKTRKKPSKRVLSLMARARAYKKKNHKHGYKKIKKEINWVLRNGG